MLALLLLALIYQTQISNVAHNILYSDFGTFYLTAHFAKLDQNLYSAIIFRQNNTLFHLPGSLNPPFFSLLLLPFVKWSYAVSFKIWIAISICCGLVGIIFLISVLKIRQYLFATLALSIALLAYYPTYVTLQFGQVSLFLLPVVIGAWWAAREHNLPLLGSLMGVLASIKLFFGLFVLYFLLRKENRALLWFSVVFITCTLLPLLFFPASNYLQYHAVLQHIYWYSSSWNASLFGFLLRVFGGPEKNIPWINLPILTSLLYWFSAGLLILSLGKALRANDKIPADIKCDLDFSLTLTTILLVAPLAWMYYFLFLIIPFATLFRLARAGYATFIISILTTVIILISNLPFALILPAKMLTGWQIFIQAGVYCYALLLLFGLLWFVRFQALRLPKTSLAAVPSYFPAVLYTTVLLFSLAGLLKIQQDFLNHRDHFMPRMEIIQPKITGSL